MVGKPLDNEQIYTNIVCWQDNGINRQRLVLLQTLLDLVAIPLHQMPGITGTCLADYCEAEWIPHYIKYIKYQYSEEMTYALKEGETSIY